MSVFLKTLISFISTNLDDLCILTVLFMTHKIHTHPLIHTGHFLGMAALLAVSTAGSMGVKIFLAPHVRYLGIIPIIMGIRYYFISANGLDDTSREPPDSVMLMGTAALTVANGADNLAVYISLFSSFSMKQLCFSLTFFALFTVILGLLAEHITDIGAVRSFLDRYSRYVVPLLLIIIGITIMLNA